MRLLRAELRKLRRPLVVWTAVAIVGVVGLHAWGLQRSARDQFRGVALGGGPIPSCKEMGMPEGSQQCALEQDRARRVFCADQNIPEGPECDQAIAQQEADQRKAQEEFLRQQVAAARVAKAIQNPFGGGILAAGMMASMVGAVILLLLAAGHVGNEWSGKTIKQVLVQEGRRWRVLLAKVVSLWLLGVSLLMFLWLALAVLAPIFHSAYHLPGARVSWGSALSMSLKPAVRALLVILVFAALGTLTAVITRNTLGSFFLGFAFVVATLILSGFKRVAAFTLAYHVAGWMGFHGGGAFGVPTYIWKDGFHPAKEPTHAAGLVGLAVTIAVCAVFAWLRVERSDVKV